MQLLLTPYPAIVEMKDGAVSSKLYIDISEVPYNADPTIHTSVGLLPKSGDTPVRFICAEERHKPHAFNDEGFCIEISKEGVEVYSNGAPGFLYAVFTLQQLQKQFPDELPCMNIADSPRWNHRGAQVCYAQINLEYREEWLFKFVHELAQMRINTLYLYIEWRFQFASVPATRSDKYISPEQVERLEEHCAKYGITVIPALNVMGHTGDFLAMQAFDSLKEYDAEKENPATASNDALCPTNPKTRELIEAALNDIMDAFTSDIIHVGGDEVSKIGVCPICKPLKEKHGAPGIYTEYFTWINKQLAKRGRKMGIWGDMLEHYLGCNPYYANTDTVDISVFEPLKENTIIYNWSYDGPAEAALKALSENGFTVYCCTSTHNCSVGAAWPGQHKNQQVYFKDAMKLKGCEGGVVTDWINGYSLHAEMSGFNYASAAALMWQGADDEFAEGSSHNEFEEAYFFNRYGRGGEAMREYIHLAGDGKGELLSMFPEGKSGSYLRKAAYLSINPIYPYFHYYSCLQNGNLDKYRECVEKLEKLFKEATADMQEDEWVAFHGYGVIMHRYLLERFTSIHALNIKYREAAELQYKDNNAFKKAISDCAAILTDVGDIFTVPKEFVAKCHTVLGLDAGSELRVEQTRKNYELLAKFIKNLADNHRPLPSLLNISAWLFSPPTTGFWEPRNDEWYAEKEAFRRVDIDSKGEWGSARW